MSNKNYINGSIKQVNTQYGTLLNCNLKFGDQWFKFTIAERRTPSEKSTHYAWENEYNRQTQAEKEEREPGSETDDFDCPF